MCYKSLRHHSVYITSLITAPDPASALPHWLGGNINIEKELCRIDPIPPSVFVEKSGRDVVVCDAGL
jgi:hypothetical protein